MHKAQTSRRWLRPLLVLVFAIALVVSASSMALAKGGDGHGGDHQGGGGDDRGGHDGHGGYNVPETSYAALLPASLLLLTAIVIYRKRSADKAA